MIQKCLFRLVVVIISLASVAAIATTPQINILNVQQRAGTNLVDITYDLSDTDSSNVAVSAAVSTNNGVTYNLPATHFSGSGYGMGVTPGTGKQIVWDAGTDWPEHFSTQVKVCVTATSGPTNELPSELKASLARYATASARYFTSTQANDTLAGLTHSYFGTGHFRTRNGSGEMVESDWHMTRGYGSYVNINEVTLAFLSLAAAYKMSWLDGISTSSRYERSWGQIRQGLETLRQWQTSGQTMQYINGVFYRNYQTTTLDTNSWQDVDLPASSIAFTGANEQSSDDNGLPYMNLLILEGLAGDPAVEIPERETLTNLCHTVRDAINLKQFIVNDRLVMNYVDSVPSTNQCWDRKSTEGAVILGATLLSGQITTGEFYRIATSLSNRPVDWAVSATGTVHIGQPSWHSALFVHGLRSLHGFPVTTDEFAQTTFYLTSLDPVTRAHIAYAGVNGFSALGSQVMSQSFNGIPLVEWPEGTQARFPGNEDNAMPVPGISLVRATASHACFVPLSRWRCMTTNDIQTLVAWVGLYETNFFHAASETDVQLGWEVAIPFQPNQTNFTWNSSDGCTNYTDFGRPYEALNAAYIVLHIFDALNPDRPLAGFNVEATRTGHIAAFFDSGIPLPADEFP